MSAAWLLNKSHHISVYEKEKRVGGHSNTVDTMLNGFPIPVDTGFIVYNDRSYPNLVALFNHLGVPTKPSNMSFSASLDNGAFEYSGSDLSSLIGQRRNILRPRFWRMIADIVRFYREAPLFLAQSPAPDISLRKYLLENKYTEHFINDHLLPMGAAIWSTSTTEIEAYPAHAFIRFFQSHGLLSLKDRPNWRTVDGGSRTYIKSLTAPYRDRVRFDGVSSIKRTKNNVVVSDWSGRKETYDHVVIAAHADEAIRLLLDPDEQEKALLGNWRYTQNRAVLHSDPSLMPKHKRVWSSWNFIDRSRAKSSRALCVTYWMNLLQSLDQSKQLFVTLNPMPEPKPEMVIKEFRYSHPFFDQMALTTQRALWKLQGRRRTWFCGSYFGYGFHEDALQSGLAVAEQLGKLKRPWDVAADSDRIYARDFAQLNAS
tara:strand:+ start:293 stop:1576 length:1284 start_codon:yes stop_codon:yes gene_type:complete